MSRYGALCVQIERIRPASRRRLSRAARRDALAARVADLHFFDGLTKREVAEAVGVSLATVKRDWQFAGACAHWADGPRRWMPRPPIW